jgi:hypothetical protein
MVMLNKGISHVIMNTVLYSESYLRTINRIWLYMFYISYLSILYMSYTYLNLVITDLPHRCLLANPPTKKLDANHAISD